jgi:ribosomal protein S12 methylthiotransferase accessory factor
MNRVSVLPAEHVPLMLRDASTNGDSAPSTCASRTADLVRSVLRRRREFGITRVGSITRLDRLGIPVVQVTRPLSLSNAIMQGKGVHLLQAAASALMEALETWAAENIACEPATAVPISAQATAIRALYAGCAGRDAPSDWELHALSWLEGWDLLTAAKMPVPLAMIDTVYTLPSPHPSVFPRTTTGLAAGVTIAHAVLHAGLEILERDAVAQARRTPFFFERSQIDVSSIDGEISAPILKRIREAKLIAGIWQVAADHTCPVYWCHLMEADSEFEIAPLPAEGFGCDFTDDAALAKALLEACQARLTAISGAREDITRSAYPRDYDREHLAEWRQFLSSPVRPTRFANKSEAVPSLSVAIDKLLMSLEIAGAQAVIVVPLFSDASAGINVVRMVAPPLRHGRAAE